MLDQTRTLDWNTLLKLQDHLNTKADPNNPMWEQIRTEEDFRLAAIVEMVELVDGCAWKWWKGGKTDMWNVKIEAIDILHFIASLVILKGIGKAKGRVRVACPTGHIEEENTLFDNDLNFNRNRAMDYITYLTNASMSEDLIAIMNDLLYEVGITEDVVSAIYIAKYTLNEIRWADGYHNNTYKKLKGDGQLEDNVFLQDVVERFKADEQMMLGEIPGMVRDIISSLDKEHNPSTPCL